MDTSPRISLIIPAHNEEKYIGECLKHVIKHSDGKLFEIIVIDNVSTDRTKEVAEQFPGVRVVYEKNKGLTSARERGRAEARGNILAYIDADTHMPKNWVARVEDEFKNHPNTVCVSGPYIYYDVPKIQQFFTKLYWYFIAMPMYLIVGYMAVGGNFAIRKETIDKMGGFDTTISFYGEDTDIARRASKFGKVVFKLSFTMYTSGRRFSGQGFLKTGFIYMANFASEVILRKPFTKEYKDIR